MLNHKILCCLPSKLYMYWPKMATFAGKRRLDVCSLRNAVRKKTGLCGKNSQVVDPLPKSPLPPVWETFVIKKKVGFIFHLRTSGTFLVFTKNSPFWAKD